MTMPLNFRVLAECSNTKARSSVLTLLHGDVLTPVFMPVGTKGAVKGVLNEQLIKMNCQILLGNTYHLGTSPGIKVLEEAKGLHKFMNWNRNILTDSGGFQMVSLLKLAEIMEEGVKFISPYDSNKHCLMTPEHSIEIQNVIGADIIMQLDDVVKTTTIGPRVQEAMERTTRWLDRCIKAHKNPNTQNIFPIVQGALDKNLRIISAQNHIKRNVNGFAIGGLSGGESKDDFWKMVSLSTDLLPKDKPRYLMGVGFAVDMVICVALGIDMFDCVFPTRTARFGCALVKTGQINLKKTVYANDLSPIDADCSCSTCLSYSRAYLHGSFNLNPVACHLITIHNLFYQFELMKNIRLNIENGTFVEFIRSFMSDFYSNGDYPQWVIDSLQSVNIMLKKTT